MSLRLQRLSYATIGRTADEFLAYHHASLSLPIPIEEIAEGKLNLEIIPVKGIKKQYDVDGCLNSDLSSIFIDYDLYLGQENRTRFTIAHEIGHLAIHGELFKELGIKTSNDLYRLSEKINTEEYGWLEFQAYSFAGHVLVPQNSLLKEVSGLFGRIPHQENPEAMFSIFQDLLDTFKVSGEVMLRRLQKEKILKSNS